MKRSAVRKYSLPLAPFGERDVLAKILADEDVVKLRHLAHEGLDDSSLQALASDLGYLEGRR